MRHLCQTAPICASMGSITLVRVCDSVGWRVCICARGRKKEQKKKESKTEHTAREHAKPEYIFTGFP